jgi:hypothetical protein
LKIIANDLIVRNTCCRSEIRAARTEKVFEVTDIPFNVLFQVKHPSLFASKGLA